MARIEKTVFISYRRTDVYTALAVYENLKNQGYDIFFDYRSIASGDFEQVISSNIRARAHFVLILTPTALDRCNEPGDWLRREIELAIDEKRNIVPLFFKGFRFGASSSSGISKWIPFGKPDVLTGKLRNLPRYNGLNVHEDYFEEGMNRLRIEFLSKPLDTVLHPVSTQVRKVVKEEQDAADEALKYKDDIKASAKLIEEKSVEEKELPKQFIESGTKKIKEELDAADEALKQREVVKEPVKKIEEKPAKKKELPKPAPSKLEKKKVSSLTTIEKVPWRKLGGIAGVLTVIALFIWGGVSDWRYMSSTGPESNLTIVPPTPIDTRIGKDGMTLLYVPAGEFTMGNDADDFMAECKKYKPDCQQDWFVDVEPPHTVELEAFWIDQTEVTNAMYAMCVDAGFCDLPSQTTSDTRDSYYGDSDFDDYPVIYVTWDDAKAYCEWADRRLPSEAEWEKAARGENKFIYPWGFKLPDSDLANYDRKEGDTTEVGRYPNNASPYGALDMAGNVQEWVEDWYDAYPGNTVSDSSYGTRYRVLRGGNWRNLNYGIRADIRDNWDPSIPNTNIGIRCAMDANPEDTETSQESNRPSPTEEILGIGSTMTGKDGMTLLYVPAGDFIMGSEDGNDNEKPVHTVYLDAFWIDQTEVTVRMYYLCVEAGTCDEPVETSSAANDIYYGDGKFDNYPVINVNWDMAKTYCEWVDRRLPTEAEWEKAARGTDANIYPWGNSFDGNLLNFCEVNCQFPSDNIYDDGFAGTSPVGNYPSGASPYGAYDMAGNVSEWVADWYDENYYQITPSSNPQGPSSSLGQYRVQRGDSYNGGNLSVRSAGRYSYPSDSYSSDIGFRCAMDASPAETETSQELNTPSPTEETLGIGSTMTGKDGMTLLYVPAGEFTIGSTFEAYMAECKKFSDSCGIYGFDEEPPHILDLSAFWIDQTEITNAMYAKCVDAADCAAPSSVAYYEYPGYANYPVLVSWNQALDYCTWAGRRLPTEAQWEKVARGEDGRLYPWGNHSPNSNFLDYQGFVWQNKTSEAGKYPNGASPYGALDMVGNAWEWVSSLYKEYPYDAIDGRWT